MIWTASRRVRRPYTSFKVPASIESASCRTHASKLGNLTERSSQSCQNVASCPGSPPSSAVTSRGSAQPNHRATEDGRASPAARLDGESAEAFGGWLDERSSHVLPKSPLGKAIAYTQAQWEDLQTYTRDGELSIDNNRSERTLRAQVLGRKNFLFVGSDRGGRTAAVLYSFVGSCKRLGAIPSRTSRMCWSDCRPSRSTGSRSCCPTRGSRPIPGPAARSPPEPGWPRAAPGRRPGRGLCSNIGGPAGWRPPDGHHPLAEFLPALSHPSCLMC